MAESKAPVPRPRVQGLSDLIFGLALSIGAIELVTSSSNVSTLNNGEIEIAVAAFAFNFLILINVWNRYTSITSVIPVETVLMVRLNMLLLFLVAIEPYFFNLVVLTSSVSVGSAVSAYYALDLGVMNIVLGYFTHILVSQGKTSVALDVIDHYRRTRWVTVVIGLLFIVSALPGLWTLYVFGTSVRVWLWLVAAPFGWATRVLGMVRTRKTVDVKSAQSVPRQGASS